ISPSAGPDLRKGARGARIARRAHGGRQAAARRIAPRLPARRGPHQVLRGQALGCAGAHRAPRWRRAARFQAPLSGPDLQMWWRDVATQMEATLAELLPAARAVPTRLHDAMRYSTLGGGKRVRAMLVFAAGEVSSADPQRLKVVAAAIEMVHAYSLIHDDLPCMDDDVLRRGKPTCHVEFDEATAVLAGDALQSRAFELLAEHVLAERGETQLRMLQQFASACGSRGMAGGQAIDLEAIGKALTLPELEFMHILKTGALIRAS